MKVILLFVSLVSYIYSTTTTTTTTTDTSLQTITQKTTDFTTQLINNANKTAVELFQNATIYAKDVLSKLQTVAKQKGIIGETVSTSLQLIGLGEGYESYEKMQIACDSFNYVNHWRQCAIHKFSGYWCCSLKNLTSGQFSCLSFTDAKAKNLTNSVSKTYSYYCFSNFMNVSLLFSILLFFIFL